MYVLNDTSYKIQDKWKTSGFWTIRIISSLFLKYTYFCIYLDYFCEDTKETAKSSCFREG